MATYSAPYYPARIIETVSQVIALGRQAQLFDHHKSDGWFTLALKDGAAVLGFAVPGPLSARLAFDYRHHSEEQVSWLRSHELLTSNVWVEHNVSEAVAAQGYDFYFSFVSALPREWNEAIVVVSAVCMRQFNQSVIDNPAWHLKSNPHINELLEVAHWTK